MNDTSLKQKALLAMLGVFLLYAFAAILWFTMCEKSWKRSAKSYAKAVETFREEEELIAQRVEWDERYEAEKAAMPVFEVGKATDTEWLDRIDALAKEKLVQLSQLQAGKEVEAGDVLEVSVETNFEASLEALVKFLYELENSQTGMFDIRNLSMRPSNKKGYLKGSMSITCAYMRGNSTGNAERR